MPSEDTPASDAPQPTEDSPSPVIEAPAPTDEPTTPPQEASPAPAESETTPATPTAQIPPNEPIEPAPEPPSSAASAPASNHSIRDLLNKARVAIQDHKRKKRDKIMLALSTKNKITNDEVEKLLHVSDATATRYLSALEKESKIKQIGKTGHSVSYSKI